MSSAVGLDNVEAAFLVTVNDLSAIAEGRIGDLALHGHGSVFAATLVQNTVGLIQSFGGLTEVSADITQSGSGVIALGAVGSPISNGHGLLGGSLNIGER